MRKNQPPYALILLGNGFDIAHDFKTSYANFMDYLLEYTRNNNFACKASHLGYYIRKDKNGEDPYIAMSNIGSPRKVKLVVKPYGARSVFFSYLFNCFDQTNTWGDFEESYFRCLDEHKGHDKETINLKGITLVNKEFEHFKELFKAYLIEQENENNEEVNKEILEKKGISELLSQKINEHEYVEIISFNYTSKIVKLMREEMVIKMSPIEEAGKSIPASERIKISHIHGELNSEDNPIIFGYGSDRSEKFKKLLQYENDELMKYMKTFLYKQNTVNDHINYCLGKGKTKVIVLGHSLSDSDSTLLNKIFKHTNVIEIELIYHQSKEKYMKKLYQFARIVNDQTIVDEKVLPIDQTRVVNKEAQPSL